jgi:hypothetical protein
MLYNSAHRVNFSFRNMASLITRRPHRATRGLLLDAPFVAKRLRVPTPALHANAWVVVAQAPRHHSSSQHAPAAKRARGVSGDRNSRLRGWSGQRTATPQGRHPQTMARVRVREDSCSIASGRSSAHWSVGQRSFTQRTRRCSSNLFHDQSSATCGRCAGNPNHHRAFRKSGRQDLNLRPPGPQRPWASPAELKSQRSSWFETS